MADILINNMEMPKTCAACRLFAVNKLYNGFTDMFEKHAFCTANHSIRFEEFDIDNIRHEACPLIELPPHGDLSPNPWHTEKPTEEGYYVLTFPNELGFADYCVGYWNGEKFLIRDAWEGDEVKPIAWQKIEPYKETNK